MKNTAPTSIAPLLERMDRIRNRARTLVRDAATADDLAQEALMVALAADGPEARPKTLGWMRVVMGNLLRDGRRSEKSRAHREGRVAAREASGVSAETVVSNAERQRDLVEAVLELEDPYRDALLLRHFEDCSPREITRRTGRPVETVRKQLQRGHEQLRNKLEGRYGDRGRWAVALLPVTGDGALRGLGGGVSGSLTTMKVAAALIAVGIVGLVSSQLPGWLSPTPSGLASGAQPTLDTSIAAIEEDPSLHVARTAEREEASIARASEQKPTGLHGSPEEVASAGPPLEPRDVLLTGLDGQPLAERDVVWEFALGEWMEDRWKSEGRLIEARTDATGRASLLLPPHPNLQRNLWRVDGAPMLAVGLRNETEHGAWRVVLAPAVRVAGQVQDHDGAPVPDASVRAVAGLEAVASFTLAPSGFSPRFRSAVTDEVGAFDFTWLPTHPAFVLKVETDEHYDSREPMPTHDAVNLVLRTGRRKQAALAIAGSVLESDGGPAAGVNVNFGHEKAKTNSAGRFTIEVPHAPMDKPITARADDGRFAVAESPVETNEASTGGPDVLIDDAVTLRLPAESLALRVRLLDAGGAPLEGCKVIPFDGTRRGSSTSYMERARFEDHRTDAEGRYTLDHALDRPYVLRFVDPETMLVVDSEPLHPGAGEHTVQAPSDAFVAELRGRILDHYGSPVVGAEVTLAANDDDPAMGVWRTTTGLAVQTDADGRFMIENAPWRSLAVSVDPRPGSGSGASNKTPLGPLPPSGPLELRMDLECEVHLVVDREDVTACRFLDEQGQTLTVRTRESGATSFEKRFARADNGSFPLFEVSQRASELVLFGADGELSRLPIRLETTGRNELRP